MNSSFSFSLKYSTYNMYLKIRQKNTRIVQIKYVFVFIYYYNNISQLEFTALKTTKFSVTTK